MHTKGTKIRLGLCPKTPYPLSCGWIRINFSAVAEKLIRTAPQIRSQGACGAFYFVFCRNRFAETELKINLISVV